MKLLEELLECLKAARDDLEEIEEQATRRNSNHWNRERDELLERMGQAIEKADTEILKELRRK